MVYLAVFSAFVCGVAVFKAYSFLSSLVKDASVVGVSGVGATRLAERAVFCNLSPDDIWNLAWRLSPEKHRGVVKYAENIERNKTFHILGMIRSLCRDENELVELYGRHIDKVVKEDVRMATSYPQCSKNGCFQDHLGLLLQCVNSELRSRAVKIV